VEHHRAEAIGKDLPAEGAHRTQAMRGALGLWVGHGQLLDGEVLDECDHREGVFDEPRLRLLAFIGRNVVHHGSSDPVQVRREAISWEVGVGAPSMP